MADKKKASSSEISLIKAYGDYVSKMLSVPGMKVLLLDEHTAKMIGMVYAHSDIVAREVVLVTRLGEPDKKAQAQGHLKAVVWVRPTPANIALLSKSLITPRYKEFHIFFTNTLPSDQLKALAEADEYELVRQIQEYYADYFAVDPFLFHAGLTRSLEVSALDRNADCLASAFLALRTQPIIRYARSSDFCLQIANEIVKRSRAEPEVFMVQQRDVPPTLLILDRRDDPVTPLLSQWTYQAMVHELLTLDCNRVDLSNAPSIREDVKEVVLSSNQDRFFKGSMYLNYGDLGMSVKELVTNYQRKTSSTSKIDSIDDMQKFVDAYPEFRQLAGNVSKHVAIMMELSRQVDQKKLLEVSELEQELACQADHGVALENVGLLLDNAKINFFDKLRVVMLYALRYEMNNQEISSFKRRLQQIATDDTQRQHIQAVDEVLKYGGKSQRGGELFDSSLISKAFKSIKSAVKGVENVFTQHKPLLNDLLEQLVAGKLKPASFPFVDPAAAGQVGKSKLVYVYMVGGVTYEEAACVHAFNQRAELGVRVMLGGSCIHNSTSFIDDLMDGPRLVASDPRDEVFVGQKREGKRQ